MNDFDWIKDIPTHWVPEKGTAWVIIDIQGDESQDVQKFLFDNGYTWTCDSGTHIETFVIDELSCIFDDDIEDGGITYGETTNVESCVDVVRDTQVDELHVFEWFGHTCKLKETIKFR